MGADVASGRSHDRLADVVAMLHAAVGQAGVAVLEVHTGHDKLPFVYLSSLTDSRGVPLRRSPEQVLGIDAWLGVVQTLSELVQQGEAVGLRRDGSGVELRF